MWRGKGPTRNPHDYPITAVIHAALANLTPPRPTPPRPSPTSYAMSEAVNHSAAAVGQICRHSRATLAHACSGLDGQDRLGRLVAAGGAYGGPSSGSVGAGVCALLLALPPGERVLEAAGAVFQPLLAR